MTNRNGNKNIVGLMIERNCSSYILRFSIKMKYEKFYGSAISLFLLLVVAFFDMILHFR